MKKTMRKGYKCNFLDQDTTTFWSPVNGDVVLQDKQKLSLSVHC